MIRGTLAIHLVEMEKWQEAKRAQQGEEFSWSWWFVAGVVYGMYGWRQASHPPRVFETGMEEMKAKLQE